MKAKQRGYSIADYIVSGRKVKRTFFERINKTIDWQLIRAMIEKSYTTGKKRGGRPCRDALMLFKLELLRKWYGMSDSQTENQVNDRLSFSAFVGIGMDESCPDSTTICRFRRSLIKAGIYDDLFAEVDRQLQERGVAVKRGTIVDAGATSKVRRPRARASKQQEAAN